MTSYVMPQHGSQAILGVLQKRGERSAAFFLPFLHKEMVLVDIGCGPGSITAVLAAKVQRTVGIDINPAAIERARREEKPIAGTSLEFVTGNMMSLPFDDNAFDAAFCHAVLYHLDAATRTATLTEVRRVLKTGGYVGVRDEDTGSTIAHPEREGLSKAQELWMRWYRHGDPKAGHFGRRQGSVLRANGFTPVWSGASFDNYSADAETRDDSVADQKRFFESIRREMIDDGLATNREIDDALSAWDSWRRDPDAMYLRCRCECVAVK